MPPCLADYKFLGDSMNRYANGSWTDGSYQKAATGLNPHPYVIGEGVTLYRFIDLHKGPASKSADGPWWFEREHYVTITSFAARHGYSVGYSARLFAAILYEWSEVNAVIRAKVVRGPLTVWKGPGKVVSPSRSDPDSRDIASPHGLLTEVRGADGQPPSSRKMTPTQGPLQVLQLYIPGLGDPHRKFSTLMSLTSFEQIETHTPRG
jgi:hypothetical protein